MAKAALYKLIDDKITSVLRPYLEIGRGPDNEMLSDVVVSEGGVISIEKAYIKTTMLNKRMVDKGMPFTVQHAYCENIRVSIPWNSWGTLPVEVEVVGLSLVLAPRQRHEWSVDDVRRHKEALVAAALQTLQKKLRELAKRNKKPNFLAGLKAKLLAHFRPEITVRAVHIRYEQLEQTPSDGAPRPPCEPFVAGFMLDSMSAKTTLATDGPARKEVDIVVSRPDGNTGVYCRTLSMGATSVLPRAQRAGASGGGSHEEGDDDDDDDAIEVEATPAPAPAAAGPKVGFTLTPRRTLRKRTERERQLQFFVEHSAIAERMQRVELESRMAPTALPTGRRDTSPQKGRRGRSLHHAAVVAGDPADGFGRHAWLIGPISLVARLSTSTAAKHAATFDYEAPLQVTSVELAELRVTANEAQLASLLSISAAGLDYKLWSQYALIRPPDGSCRPGPSYEGRAAARELWRCAGLATIHALAHAKKGGSACNVVRVLERSTRYKQLYAMQLHAPRRKSGGTRDASPTKVAISSSWSEANALELQGIEDELPVATLAWNRRLVVSKGKANKKEERVMRKLRERSASVASEEGGSSDDEDEGGREPKEEGETNVDDQLARELLEAKVDERITEAPVGYVHGSTDVSLAGVLIRLVQSSANEEPSLRLGSNEPIPEHEMLRVVAAGIGARIRKVCGRGTETRLAVAHVAILAGPAATDGAAEDGDRVILRVCGDASATPTSEMLGGDVWWPGDIMAFIMARRIELQSCLTSVRNSISSFSMRSSTARKSVSDRKSTTVKLRASATVSVGHRSSSPSIGEHDEEVELADEFKQGSPSSRRRSQLASTSEGEGEVGEWARAEMALQVRSLKSADAESPSELEVSAGRIEMEYSVLFWNAMHLFFGSLERVKRHAQLGASAVARKKYKKLERTVDGLLLEGYYFLQLKMRTPFLSITDIFDEPSPLHRLEVKLLGGVGMRMTNELATDGYSDLLTLELPPITVAREPAVGPRKGVGQTGKIVFGGKGVPAEITMGTPAPNKVLKRALAAAAGTTDPNVPNIHQGMLHQLMGDVRATQARIEALRQEERALMRHYHKLRAAGIAGTLELLDGPSAPPPSPRTPRTPSPATPGGENWEEKESFLRDQLGSMMSMVQEIPSALPLQEQMRKMMGSLHELGGKGRRRPSKERMWGARSNESGSAASSPPASPQASPAPGAPPAPPMLASVPSMVKKERTSRVSVTRFLKSRGSSKTIEVTK